MTEWSLRPSRLGLETQASATARGWLRAAGPYLLALLVPGGVATALLGQLGAEQRRATESLAKQVQGLAGAVERLDERSRTTSEDVAGIRGRLEVIANLRGRLAEADSYLEQDRPALARAALREEGPTMGAPRPTVASLPLRPPDSEPEVASSPGP